jgi:hypothetical protein
MQCFCSHPFKPSDEGAIVSVGSGPGAELVTAHDYFKNQKLKYLAVDVVEEWAGYINCLGKPSFTFCNVDMEKTTALCELLRSSSAEVVLFAHVLVDFGEPSIVSDLFKRVANLKCIIVVDRYIPRKLEKQKFESVTQRPIDGKKYKYKGAVYMREEESNDLSAMMNDLKLTERKTRKANA